MSYVVMDLELKETVNDNNGGWDAARRGERGIAVAGLYDSEEDWYSLYDESILGDLATHLESADTLVTFNGLEFDVPCLQGVLGRTLLLRGHYDLLQSIWSALPHKTRGYRLGEVARRTIGRDKLEAGSGAPQLWEAGRFAELHNYCLMDVHLTRKLFEFVLENGYIIDPSGNPLYLDPHLALGDFEMTIGRT